MSTSYSLFFFKKIPLYLICCLPFFLITGPFLPDLAISLLGVIFLIEAYKKKLKKYFFNYFFLFFLFFYFILIISSLLSIDPLFSLKSSFFYFRFGIFACAMWHYISSNSKILSYLFFSLIFCFLILIFDGFFQFIFGKNIFSWPMQQLRVSSFFKDELILGSYIARLLPIFLSLVFIFISKKNYFTSLFSRNLFLVTSVFLFFLSALIILVYLSGERSAFLLMIFSLMTIVILIDTSRYIKFFLSISLMIFLSFSVVFFSKNKERIFNHTFHQLGFTGYQNSDSRLYFFSIEHEHLYKSAIKMFTSNKITGVGPKIFRKRCSEKNFKYYFSCSTHPHNSYIQLLAETGIFGFGLIFLTFLILLKNLIKHFFLKYFKQKYLFSNYEICLLASLLISLWPIVPTGNFFNNWINVVYFLPAGLLLQIFDQNGRINYFKI